MVAAHLSHSSLDEVSGWSLRQCVSVVRHAEDVMPLINPMAEKPSKPTTHPEAHRAVAHAFGLVKRR